MFLSLLYSIRSHLFVDFCRSILTILPLVQGHLGLLIQFLPRILEERYT